MINLTLGIFDKYFAFDCDYICLSSIYVTCTFSPKGPPAYWIGLNDRDTEAGKS